MNLGKVLDLAIKASEGGPGDGYQVETGKIYDSYMEKTQWDAFVTQMQTDHPAAFRQYGAGGGGELEEKTRCGKTTPPKMASYGSSSRMTYLLSREIPDFQFERKCATGIGGTANLDGYVEQNGHRIYVEAKCREPYGKEKGKIKAAYKDLYEHITEKMGENLICRCSDVGKDTMMVTFLSGGEEILHFDIKQMICHLLGIAREARADAPVDFLYLLYDPSALGLGEHRQDIMEIYERTCAECEKIDFVRLFDVITDYMKTEKPPFSFRLCNGEAYRTYLLREV